MVSTSLIFATATMPWGRFQNYTVLPRFVALARKSMSTASPALSEAPTPLQSTVSGSRDCERSRISRPAARAAFAVANTSEPFI